MFKNAKEIIYIKKKKVKLEKMKEAFHSERKWFKEYDLPTTLDF